MVFINFLGILQTLGDMGFFAFVLPWLLFIILIHEILMFARPMNITAPKSAVLAAIISFFIVNFTPFGFSLGQFLTNFFGVMSMYMTAVLVFILFLGLAGFRFNELWGMKYAYPLLFLLITILIFANASPLGIPFLDLSAENLTLLFVIVLIVGVVGLLASQKTEPAGETKTK